MIEYATMPRRGVSMRELQKVIYDLYEVRVSAEETRSAPRGENIGKLARRKIKAGRRLRLLELAENT